MKKWLLAMSSIIVLLMFTACSKNELGKADNGTTETIMTEDEKAKEDQIVLTINNTDIYGNTYNQTYWQIKKLMLETNEDGNVNTDEVRALTLDAIMDKELLIQLAEQEGISISEEQVKDKLAEMEKINIIGYEKMRNQFNNIEEAIENQLKFELARRHYIQDFIKIEVSDSEVKEVYTELQEEIDGIQDLKSIEDDLKEMIRLQKTDEKLNDIILSFKKESDVEVKI